MSAATWDELGYIPASGSREDSRVRESRSRSFDHEGFAGTSRRCHGGILALAIVALFCRVGSAGEGPCDIYQSGGTPCVAAHSTVRALFGNYEGSLYQVRRASDNATKDVPVLSSGGYADLAVQDVFCANTSCTISKVFDQTTNHNDLVKSPKAYWLPDGGKEANASNGAIQISGHAAHGVAVDAWSGVGYRNNATKGVATGNQAEAMYMVVDGRRFSDACCFDYGNAETSGNDDGNGTMEAIYWGTDVGWGGYGLGNGPWVAADLENGMFKGNEGHWAYGDTHKTPWPTAQSVVADFATAMLKGPSTDSFVLKAGDANAGPLVTMWNGPRPTPGYSPKTLQGAIILGTGGDGSPGGAGTFFEGAMTIGLPSSATDEAVQANIVAAGYGKSAPVVTVPSPRDTVFNGAFDLGTLGWTFNVWGGGAKGSVVGGEYEIQIDSVGTHNSDIQAVQNGIVLVQGKTYKVTFDARAAAPRSLEANVEKDDSPWTSYLPALRNFELTTAKTAYSYTFTMTEPTDSNGRISFNAGSSTESVFLDDISIEAVDNPESIHLSGAGNGIGTRSRLDGSRLEIEVDVPQGTAIRFGILDVNGKSVRSSSIRSASGNQQSWQTDLSGLPRGVYLLRIDASGFPIQRSKFLYGR